MITFFTIPRPFLDQSDIIQRNAIQSWIALGQKSEVLLIGDETGVDAAAGQYGCRYFPNVVRNDYGTPLVNDAFHIACENARNSILCYVNSDIILPPNFLEEVKKVRRQNYLVVGRRWNFDHKHPIDFNDENWFTSIKSQAEALGELYIQFGMDFFVFPKSSYLYLLPMPGFAIGRPAWDNWLISKARIQNLPVIDATNQIFVLHQNHHYNHVKNRTGNNWEGPEAEDNRRLMGDPNLIFGVFDSTHYLKGQRIRWGICQPYLDMKMAHSTVIWQYRQDGLLDKTQRKLFWHFYHWRRWIPDVLWNMMIYHLSA